jgi:hypothetical protein
MSVPPRERAALPIRRGREDVNAARCQRDGDAGADWDGGTPCGASGEATSWMMKTFSPGAL